MNGSFSEEALRAYAELAAQKQGLNFAEGDSYYDFTRCVRPDGSAYGTKGKCEQGRPETKEEETIRELEESRDRLRAQIGFTTNPKAKNALLFTLFLTNAAIMWKSRSK
jgi:hypothetical protein